MFSWIGKKLVALLARGASDNKDNRKAFLRTVTTVGILMDKDDPTAADRLKKAALEKIQAEVLESKAKVEEQMAAVDVTRANAELIRAKAEAVRTEADAKKIKAIGDAFAKVTESVAKFEAKGGSFSISKTDIIQVLRSGTKEFPDDPLIAQAASKIGEAEQ